VDYWAVVDESLGRLLISPRLLARDVLRQPWL
jgi:hypothetical protein